MEYELRHDGVKGMHWGIRRYQNEDGSYTDLGRKHYGIGGPRNGSSAPIKKGSISSLFKKNKPKENDTATEEQKKLQNASKDLFAEAMRRSTEGLQKKGAKLPWKPKADSATAKRLSSADFDGDTVEPHKALLAAVEKGDRDTVRSLAEQNKDIIDDLISKAAASDKHAHSMSDVAINEENIRRAISDVKGDSGSKPEEMQPQAKTPETTVFNKSVSEMSDAEIAKLKTRLENENKIREALDKLYANAPKENPIAGRIEYGDPGTMTTEQMQKAVAQMNAEKAYREAMSSYLASKKETPFSQQIINAGKSAVKDALLNYAKEFSKDFAEGFLESFSDVMSEGLDDYNRRKHK